MAFHKKLYACVLIFLFALISCSDTPLSPEETDWVTAVILPSRFLSVTGIACRDDGAVFVTTGSCFSKVDSAIYKYHRGTLTKDFGVRYDWSFYGISSCRNVLYAIGSKATSDGVPGPYILLNDGSGWRELEFPLANCGGLEEVEAVNDGKMWVSGSFNYSDGSVPVKYDNGDWTVYEDVNGVTSIAYGPEDGVFYCARAARGGDETYKGDLVMTADGGETWVYESINENSKEFEIELDEYTELSAVPGALIFNADVTVGGATFDGVVKRTGPPGAGNYDVLFFSPLAPFFWDIRGHAFKDVFNGITVGRLTSVVYNSPDWVLEEVTGEDFHFEFITVGPDGYWAVAEDEGGLGGDALMYHP